MSSGTAHVAAGGGFGNTVVAPLGIVMAVTLGMWAVREARRGRTALAVLMGAGTAATCTDSAVRLLSGLAFTPSEEHPVFYRAFGLDTPLWALAAYASLFPGIAYVGYRAVAGAWRRKKFWLAVGGMVLGQVAFDLLAVHVVDLCHYAGANQPLRVWDVPVFWSAVWVIAPVVVGMVYARSERHPAGASRWLAVLLLGTGNLGPLAVLVWPTVTALHSSLTNTLVSVIAVTNAVLVAAAVHLLAAPRTAPAPRPDALGKA
ncbi:hypothetical protein GCM10010129_68630 [Streptomyces fumigatiscleroticus]|nr:hypothetical protein GCM10010129_68630 [Streptomyces fumigatiscleroticus]